MRNWIFAAVGVVGMVATTSASAGTLEDVRARGHLNCIGNTGLTGFASPDDAGNWTGFDVEFCRAVAAAVRVVPALAVHVCEALLVYELRRVLHPAPPRLDPLGPWAPWGP